MSCRIWPPLRLTAELRRKSGCGHLMRWRMDIGSSGYRRVVRYMRRCLTTRSCAHGRRCASGADVASRSGTHFFTRAKELSAPGCIAYVENACLMVVALALMAHGKDRHRSIVVDFEQRYKSRCAERNDQFP